MSALGDSITEDKPLRYLLIFSHVLIANYDEILRESWIQSVKYVLNQTECIDKVLEYLSELRVSTVVEDDLADKLLAIMNSKAESLKYELMSIKDKFFEDNMHKIELHKGARILLRELREVEKWTLCLLHKDSRKSLNLIVDDIGLRGYFNCFVCAASIANYSRPYIQMYEQSISRCRIFKRQCIVVTNHCVEAMEAIHFGILPILCGNAKEIKMDGKYFQIEQLAQIQKLLSSIRQSNACKYINYGCFEVDDDICFFNEDDGKVYEGKIDKLSICSPVKIYKIKYADSEKNIKNCLKQNYFIWQNVENIK